MASIIIHSDNQKDLTLLQVTNSDKEDFILTKSIKQNNPADQLSFSEAEAYYQMLNKSDK